MADHLLERFGTGVSVANVQLVGSSELRLRNVEQRYSRDFIPGMRRQEIESRLLSEGIRFWPGPPQYEFVSLGEEVRYSIVCASREVGLMLQFKSGRQYAFRNGSLTKRQTCPRRTWVCVISGTDVRLNRAKSSYLAELVPYYPFVS